VAICIAAFLYVNQGAAEGVSFRLLHADSFPMDREFLLPGGNVCAIQNKTANFADVGVRLTICRVNPPYARARNRQQSAPGFTQGVREAALVGLKPADDSTRETCWLEGPERSSVRIRPDPDLVQRIVPSSGECHEPY
jgi:hypothetical protein